MNTRLSALMLLALAPLGPAPAGPLAATRHERPGVRDQRPDLPRVSRPPGAALAPGQPGGDADPRLAPAEPDRPAPAHRGLVPDGRSHLEGRLRAGPRGRRRSVGADGLGD